jgi:hypothetical protein
MDADHKQQKQVEPMCSGKSATFQCSLIAAAQPLQKICVHLRPSAVKLF